jgi:hypothetical protein
MKNSILKDNWNFLKPLAWPRLKKTIDKQLERADKLIARIKSEELRSTAIAKSERFRSEAKMEAKKLTSTNNNSRNLPGNATIREEYVRCGKQDCQCKHGPYYYTYWRDDSGKLKKKYIGKYPPSGENRNKSGLNDDGSSTSRDPLTVRKEKPSR